MSDERDPVLITDAPMSYEDQLAARKHRYKIMMGMRIPLMVLAAAFYQFPWIAVSLLVVSIPLPWMAVLIANDRMPRKVVESNRYRAEHEAVAPSSRPAIESRPHPIIDADGYRDGDTPGHVTDDAA